MWISQDLSSEGGNKFMMMNSQSVIKQQQQQENNNNNKSNFSQTCNLLSQYLKEKGSFGDLSLGIMARNPSFQGRTENNLTSPITEMPAVTVSGRNYSPISSFSSRDVKSMDLFPQNTGFGPFQATSMETIQKKATDFSLPKVPETAQMTIFYAGKVIVFDDLPADKAKEVMLLASQSSPQNFTGSLFASPANEREILNNFTTSIAKNELPPRPDHHQPIASDLPIARKASLHRFLEKRKDRISSKAPYQITNNSSSVSAATATGKPPIKIESKSWLGLASH